MQCLKHTDPFAPREALTTVWKKSPPCPKSSFHLVHPLFLLLSPHLELRLSTSHYPPSSVGLITPRLVLLLPPTAPSLSHNLSFIAALTLLFILVPPFTFPHLPPMNLGILSLCPAHHPSIPHVPSIFCCSDITGLMPLGHSSCHVRLDLGPMSKGIGLPPNGW